MAALEVGDRDLYSQAYAGRIKTLADCQLQSNGSVKPRLNDRDTSPLNAERRHSGTNAPTTIANVSPQSVNSYDDFLPASHRTSNDDVKTATPTIDFLRQELGVKRLNDIHEWLWLAGRPMPPRPLYYQKVLRRDIVIHELMDFHLTWDERRIFLKPIPRYLLNQQFWQDNLSCKEGCGSTSNNNNQGSRQDVHSTQEKTATTSACERCEIHQYALGFMLSYASLISYESDLHTAKDVHLVPTELTWQQWRAHVRNLLELGKRRRVNQRYIFGELRLDRLNKIYRYSFRAPIRGYLYGYTSYMHFWRDNLVRIASLFAYLVVVLTAMQVGLATDQLKDSYAFQQTSYGFTMFSIVAPLGFVGLFFAIFFVIFLFNLDATLKFWKRRRATIERSLAANAA